MWVSLPLPNMPMLGYDFFFFFLASFFVTVQQERIHWFCLCVLAKLSIKVVFRKRS